MIIEKNEKVFIVERKYFNEDTRRIFCGDVIMCTENLLRAKGYVWFLSHNLNQFVKKPELREKIFCFSTRLLINIIPPDIDLNLVHYAYDQKMGHIITDGKDYSMNIDEFGH